MRMRNKSSRPNREVLDLILFVRQYSKCSDHVKITIEDHDYNNIDGVTRDFVEESIPMEVIVRVFPDRQFPSITRYDTKLPSVEFRDWKDHFVLTLGHELHHAWQFENREACNYYELLRTDGGHDQIELDAETMGLRILREYKAKKLA